MHNATDAPARCLIGGARWVLLAILALVSLGTVLVGTARSAAAHEARPSTAPAQAAIAAASLQTVRSDSGQPTCRQGSLSRQQAIEQLHQVRASIDRSLRLLDAGERNDAFAEARSGYLRCFDPIEAPLDVVAGVDFRFGVEDAFARVRALIDSGASNAEVRDRIVTLRGLIDETERRLTTRGVGAPLLVFGQSFTLLLREGLEAVLLISVLLTYLESTKNGRYKAPILYGVGFALVATVLAYLAMSWLFSVLPVGRELVEAFVGVAAVGVLFYVSFWLVARMEQRRWLEFLKAKVWTAVSAGSAVSLGAIGFTSVFREGVESALFYQALFSFSQGMHAWVWAGILSAAVLLGGAAYGVLRLGRRLPVRTFLSIAVIVVMATSVAVLGNAMRGLQEATILNLHVLEGWPNLPIFLAQAVGYYPTLPSVLAQAALTGVYVLGAVYVLVVRPRLLRARPPADSSPALQASKR